jgi:hypothetical protein
VVSAGRVNSVLIGDDLPELGTDLVAALAALNVDDFTHCSRQKTMRKRNERTVLV